MNTGAERGGTGACGGFRLGELHLALPMAAIREVLDGSPLVALPCAATGVIGGIEVRGVVVPVLDLRAVLGRPLTPLVQPCVMVMVHAGAMLGLLAEGVSGIFDGSSARPGDVRLPAGGQALFDGCLRADDGGMVSLLSPPALAALPGVPMVNDPEPHRFCMADSDSDAEADPGDPAQAGPVDAVPTLLVRCGTVLLAIDAVAVETTLSDPRVEPSPLARGHCVGVLPHGGIDLPVLDLPALCGLGRLAAHTGRQAFLVRHGAALVAFLVDQVLDIVPVAPAAVARLPAFAVPRPGLFAGALPAAVHAGASGESGWACLLLDPAGLRGCEEVVALSSLAGGGAASEAADAGLAASAADARSMLVYELGAETATPLDQVSEILPFTPVMAGLHTDGPVRGLVVHRGRSVAVVCLAELTGRARTPPTGDASVLLVECGGNLLGFIVPRLRSIEAARWEPRLRARAGDGDGSEAGQTLVLLGDGPAERLVPLLDLQRLARSLDTGTADNTLQAHALAA